MIEVESSAADSLTREKLSSYLRFSEQYLEQLLTASVAIKGKEAKVLKISTYNQTLVQMLAGHASRMASSESDQKSAADRIMVKQTGRQQSQQCLRCRDRVPQLEEQLRMKDDIIERLMQELSTLKSQLTEQEILLQASQLQPNQILHQHVIEETENVAPDSGEKRQQQMSVSNVAARRDETEDNMIFHSCVQQTEDLIKSGQQFELEDIMRPGQRLEDLLKSPENLGQPPQFGLGLPQGIASSKGLDVLKPKHESEASLDEIEDDDHENSVALNMSATHRETMVRPQPGLNAMVLNFTNEFNQQQNMQSAIEEEQEQAPGDDPFQWPSAKGHEERSTFRSIKQFISTEQASKQSNQPEQNKFSFQF